jgi:hypothetical protein
MVNHTVRVLRRIDEVVMRMAGCRILRTAGAGRAAVPIKERGSRLFDVARGRVD